MAEDEKSTPEDKSEATSEAAKVTPVAAPAETEKKDPEKTVTEEKSKPGAVTPQEETAKQVMRRVVAVRDPDYWVIRLNKKIILLLVGVAILVMWLIPIGKWWLGRTGRQIKLVSGKLVVEQEVKPSETAEEANSQVRIRIRNSSNDLAEGESLKQRLQALNEIEVELVTDLNATVSGLMIAVKPEAEALGRQLEELLVGDYRVATSSVQLTQDSDFDGVVFLGVEARR